MADDLFASVRVFFAIEPSMRAMQQVLEETTALRDGPFKDAALRWANPPGWHVTLAYLGDLDVGLVSPLRTLLASLKPRPRRVELAFDALGAFPRAEATKIVMRTVSGTGSEALAAVESELRLKLEDLGLGSETPLPYVPHLTLARAHGEAIDLRNFAVPASVARFEPVAVTLFESRLEAGARRYIPLASVAW